ncbi:hypothetical protein [Tamaricihabitans halophyticus]|uniref:hypothetical protein n=1 Tax=Tamaricihabitans halophyticus TaxID=1262583 RepID=UPI00105316F3|nr:hypothetical protein [Tamaricihabitans halophyticus]
MTEPGTEYAVDAEWLAERARMPDHCARHGAPSVQRVAFDLQSRPPKERASVVNTNALTTYARMADWGSRVRITKVRDWPLCASCVRTRRSWRLLSRVLGYGGLGLILLAIVLRLVLGEAVPELAIPLVVGVLLGIAAPFAFARAGLARLVGARTSADGAKVILRDPHPAFRDVLVR